MPTKKPTSNRPTRASKTTRIKAAGAPSNVVNIVERLEAKGLGNTIQCQCIRIMGILAVETGFDEARRYFDKEVRLEMSVIFAA